MQRQLVANGEVLARYGDAPTSEENATQTNNPVYVDTADFRLQAAQIRPRHKSMDPIAYTVVGGETLKDIARNMLGDASLWWRIAEANSLAVSVDGALTAGQTLTIPKLSLNANSVDTFQPYDPSQAMGSMDPVLPVPVNGGGCGGIGAIIMVAIVVVVTIYTAGALSTVAGSATFGQTMAAGAATLSGTGTVAVGSAAASMGLGSAGAAAMAGAVGSIAGQMAGNVMGIQDGFSWKSVALSALGSGVASGLGSSGWLPSTDSAFTNAAVRQAMSSTISQGIGTVTGLQQRFDWKAVAAGAVGAGVGSSVGGALDKGNVFGSWGSDFATGLARGTLSGFAAGMTTAVMKGGRVSVQQVATDAFGNALGNSIAAANGQSGGRSSSQQEDVLGDFIARNNNFAERPYSFADSVATRRAANNPAGLPTYAPNAADDNPMAAVDYRNGNEITSDTYNGSRRTITIEKGQGPLAAMAAMGFNDQQQRAMYGQLARSGQLSFDGKGTPLVQPGQQLYVDLDDMSGARLGGRLIGAESSKRAALAAAEQRAYWDSLQSGAWSGRTSGGGPVWHAGGAQQVTGSAVDLIPTGGYAYVPAPQSMQPTGWIGKGLELIDDFNNSWVGKAAQGWPQENFAVGGAKAALVFAGTMGRNLLGDAGAVDRVFTNVAREASTIESLGNAGNASPRQPVVIDLFGGRTSQIPGAINVDIVAQEGVRASATQLPFRAGSADQIVASSPYLPGGSGIMDWLPGAADTLKPGGTLTINATPLNKFGQLPSAEVLDSLGLRVVQPPGPLLPDFRGNIFRYTDGGVIPPGKVGSTVLQKTGG